MRQRSLGQPSLWQLGDAWLRRASEVVAASAPALDAMNVFPVSDADTGSNLQLTIGGIASSVTRFQRASLDDVVQAAILSAHGNSGAIVAEMFTSVCRALARHPERLAVLPPGGVVAALLRTVSDAANQAVAEPVVGTILTVAEEAARRAEEAAGRAEEASGRAEEAAGDPSRPTDALSVALAAQDGAHVALARTPDQLDVLGRAGVVDAGGQAFVLLIDVLVEVLGGPRAEPLPPPGSAMASSPPESSSREISPPESHPPAASSLITASVAGENTPVEYEVMYALRGCDRPVLDALRRELSVLGRSVVVVGDEAVAQVHVHLHDAGAAIEAALDRGTLSRIRVTALETYALGQAADGQTALGPGGRPGEQPSRRPVGEPDAPARTVVSVVAGAGLADAVASTGAVPVLHAPGEPVTADELGRVIAAAHGDVVVLPNDPVTLATARRLAQPPGAGDGNRRIAVIPTTAQVQGMAALAVHEPTADFAAAVVAMSNAAGHARHGAVTVAERSAMTMAGACREGDVLGLVEGDFVEIGASVVEVGWRVVRRLLAGGGELLTLVGGAGLAAGVLDELTDRATAANRTLEIERLDGGQPRYLLLVGLE